MDLRDILGYQLNTAAKLMKRMMDANLLKYGITTSQWAVLKLLDEKGKLTQTEIANELLGDKATTGDVILRLCEKEYLQKSSDKKDKRIYVVSLTPKAADIISDIEHMAEEVSNKALDGFNEDGVKTFYSYLNQVIDNLTKEGSL